VGSFTGTGTLDLTNTGSPLIVTLTSIFGGAVTGDGSLESSGSGTTLTLNGSLAGFTGNLLAADGGSVVVGTGAGQLASSVNLNINNNLSISLSYSTLASAGNAVNFTGNTGTAGELLVTGTGTGTLGAITITDTTGTTTNTIDGGGVANTLALGGSITSAGAGNNTLILQNGTFVLNGTSNTTFASGTLQIGNGTLAGTAPGAAAQFTSANNLPMSAAGIALNAATLDYTGTGNVTVPNGISLANATTNILENSGTGTETLSGPITIGSSTLAFSGGTFNLNEVGSGTGTFQIGDAPSTVIVSNPNAFGAGAVIVNTGSTLETLGASTGSGPNITINAGSYTQQANSTLKLLVTGSGNDSVALGAGNASINGTLDLIFASGSNPAKGNIYDIITTTGTVTGNFSVPIVLTNAGNPELRGISSFDRGVGEIVTLETQYFPDSNIATFTPNEQAVAVYLNTNAIGSSTSTPILNVLNAIAVDSAPQQAAFLNSVTPQAYAQLTEQSIQSNTFLAQQLFQQVENAFDVGGFNTSGLTMLKTTDQNPFSVSMDAAMASARQQAQNSAAYLDSVAMPGAGPEVPAQESPSSGFSGFVLGTITVDQLAEDSGYPEQHFTTGNVMAGLDYRLNRNLVVGALFNWGYTGGTVDSYGSRQQSSSYTPGVYIGYKQGGFYADGLMSYTYNAYKINRNVASTVATGEPDSNEYDANALVGYYFPITKGLQAGPAAGAGFTQINTSGYSETGSPFDLTVAKQHADSLRSLLGMQALYTFVPRRMPLPISINFNAFWQHEFLNSSRNMTASFTSLGSGSFLYNTPGPSRDSALLGLGASGYLTKNVSLFVNYETQVGDKNQFAQTVMAGVAVNF
ncbi:MAG: autotransporter domain-containing protein, partial [Phycisphaerae bacterium]